jgi:hypothetical protein
MNMVNKERQQIKRKKCFPNKRVDDIFWNQSKKIRDESRLVSQAGDYYEMFLTAFEEGYKKGFASAEAYVSEKELYQELADEFEQMTKNDTYEELYGSRKEVK